jgi:hypothetical protein
MDALSQDTSICIILSFEAVVTATGTLSIFQTPIQQRTEEFPMMDSSQSAYDEG